MSYNYDWIHNRRRSINEDAVIDLTFPDEKDLEPERPQREPTVHDGYIIDEDGDKIFIGRATIAQPAKDNDYDGQPKVGAVVDPIKENVPRIEFANSENRRKGTMDAQSSHFPPDPEPDYEESLEEKGATVTESITHFPASNTQLIKRSMTPDERRASSYF